ncbi:MAG: M28 family peptidase [Actinobacteria bacterium]|nr:M28 family peptidase [Actinomycetota bacterium]
MEGNDPILHHTVSGGEGSRGRQRKKGVSWPARHLARDIGPRPPGSQGERSAGHFIAREFKALGMSAETQAFRTPATTAWSEMLVHLFPVIGVLIFPVNSHISYLLICLSFLFFLLEEYGRSPFTLLQIRRRTGNVLTKIDALHNADRKVVLIAHMDSPHTAFYYRPGIINLLRVAFIVDFICQAAIFMLFTVAYGGYLLSMEKDTLTLLWHIGLLLAIFPALSLFALLIKAATAQVTPGGNHNASGVAVLMELARVYSRRQPHNIDLWLVSTAAADAGGLGAKRLIRKYRRELKGAYFIIIDGVGRGFPICYSREGRLIPFRASRRLTKLVKHISEVHAHYSAGFRRNSLYVSEGFQLLSRGRKAITISSREEKRYPRYFKWVKDDYDNIDPRSLRLALDFIIAMVDNIDRGDSK